MAESRGYRVGVVGATGAVGSTILEVLAEREFPASEVVPFASERSAGKKVDFNGSQLECRPLTPESIQGLDLALASAGGKISAEWAPRLIEAGAVVVGVGNNIVDQKALAAGDRARVVAHAMRFLE